MKARWQFWAGLAASLLLLAAVSFGIIVVTHPLPRAHIVSPASAQITVGAEGRSDDSLALNDVLVFGDIDQEMAIDIALKIHKLDNTLPDDAPIVVLIDSGGGDMFAGSMIVDAMETSSHKIITVDMGLAESAAGFIFLAGDERLMWPHGMLMLHDAQLSISGTPDQSESALAMLKKKLAAFEERAAKMAGISLKEYHKRAAARWYMNAEEALKAGFATEIVSKEG